MHVTVHVFGLMICDDAYFVFRIILALQIVINNGRNSIVTLA